MLPVGEEESDDEGSSENVPVELGLMELKSSVSDSEMDPTVSVSSLDKVIDVDRVGRVVEFVACLVRPVRLFVMVLSCVSDTDLLCANPLNLLLIVRVADGSAVILLTVRDADSLTDCDSDTVKLLVWETSSGDSDLEMEMVAVKDCECARAESDLLCDMLLADWVSSDVIDAAVRLCVADTVRDCSRVADRGVCV